MRLNYLRILAFVLGGISTIIAAGALYVYASFDGSRTAAELSQLAKQRYQRTLRIDGPLSLTVFPLPTLHLPATSLSTRNGSAEFMAVDHASIGIRLLPLLTRRLVISELDLDGLRLTLLRDKKGQTNIDDLIGENVDAVSDDTNPRAPIPDIGALRIHGGAVSWNDEGADRQFTLSAIELESDRLASGSKGEFRLSARLTRRQPAADLDIAIQTAYQLGDAETGNRIRHLKATLRGDMDGWHELEATLSADSIKDPGQSSCDIEGFSVQASAKADSTRHVLRGTIPRLQWSPKGPGARRLEASLHVEGSTHNGTLRVNAAELASTPGGIEVEKTDTGLDWQFAPGQLSGHLTGPLRWQASSRTLELPALTGKMTFLPAGSASPQPFSAELSARLQPSRNNAAGRVTMQADDSRITGSWTYTPSASPAIAFDLAANRLDLDALLATTTPEPTRHTRPAGAPSTPDVGVLQALDLDGRLSVEHIKVGGLRLEQLKLPVRIRDGKLTSSGHSVALYGGRLDGSLGFSIEDRQLTYRGYLQNASLAPLLRDLNGRETLTGNANFFVDVSSGGADGKTGPGGLNGLARLRIRDARVPGIDIAQALREWRPLIGARQGARRDFHDKESTAIGELTASFQVRKGIAHSSDLQAKGGMLKVTAEGDLDLTRQQVDYLSRVTLLVVPIGPDSGLLSSLRGITVPIRVKGPLHRPDWHLEPSASIPAAVIDAGRGVVRKIPRILSRSLGKVVEKVLPSAPPLPAE